MKLETAVQIWTREALAHGYAGFIVVNNPDRGLDRIFFKDNSEIEITKENCKDNMIRLVTEVWV